MSITEKLLSEVKVFDILIEKNDYQAVYYALGRMNDYMDTLDVFVSQHNYRRARMEI